MVQVSDSGQISLSLRIRDGKYTTPNLKLS